MASRPRPHRRKRKASDESPPKLYARRAILVATLHVPADSAAATLDESHLLDAIDGACVLCFLDPLPEDDVRSEADSVIFNRRLSHE